VGKERKQKGISRVEEEQKTEGKIDYII